MKDLDQLYQPDGNERVGFILKDGSVIEVTNICEKPEAGFDVSGADIMKYMDDAQATWHTHPGASKNLSLKDYETFQDWPHIDHYIIGSDGTRRYYVEDGEVLQNDA